jgi:hypothetical protein
LIDSDVEISGRDETAQLLRSMSDMMGYLKEIATISQRIASGDLTTGLATFNRRQLWEFFRQMVRSARVD